MDGQPQSSNQATARQGTGSLPLTDELVEQVAERVYQLLLRDLRLERERQGWYSTAAYPYREER